jgi:DNA-binding transcriptional regulator YiaG
MSSFFLTFYQAFLYNSFAMKNIDKEKLKERFLGFRNKLGLTQQESARLFGVTLQAWQNWEYGNHAPNFSTLKLLEIYEASPPEKPDIAKMCKLIRLHLGLNKGSMAKFFGVDPDSWGSWERGVMKPSNQHLQKIEQMFTELNEKETLQKVS